MAFRFVHTADIHLDSPLRSLALRDAEIAELIGNATRQAFERTVELCLDERVDALMIAGDLYDGDLRSMKTAVFFGVQMRRLTAAGIQVFVIRGNHDAESVITKHLSLPEDVHVFTVRAEAVTLEGRDVVVHGVSFVTCFRDFGPSEARKFSVRHWCCSRGGSREAIEVQRSADCVHFAPGGGRNVG